jgi:hypothetical protein
VLAGGLPYAAMMDEIKAMGIALPAPPSEEASRLETMRSLWQDAGLVNVETRTIEVQRSFESFERFWEIAQTGPRVAARVAQMGEDERAHLRDGLRRRLPSVDAQGRLTYRAWANAIKGRVPAESCADDSARANRRAGAAPRLRAMKDGPNIARIAGLIGEPARAEMLTALLGGRALTATSWPRPPASPSRRRART